ncbi:MAG: hypothetical protein WA172_00065, partial [Terriglobales bacterium]
IMGHSRYVWFAVRVEVRQHRLPPSLHEFLERHRNRQVALATYPRMANDCTGCPSFAWVRAKASVEAMGSAVVHSVHLPIRTG